MAMLAAYPAMMRRDRHLLGLRECRAAWLLGVTVREYRGLEAGDRTPDIATWARMCEVFGWASGSNGNTMSIRRERLIAAIAIGAGLLAIAALLVVGNTAHDTEMPPGQVSGIVGKLTYSSGSPTGCLDTGRAR